MRILFINQFYWPDAAATGQLLTDVTRVLADAGHQVEVICAKGSYAAVDVVDDPPPVTVHRLEGLPFSHGKVSRVLSYLSFYLACLWKTLRMPKPDLVITMTTPPLLVAIGALLERFRGVRHMVWAMDLFPQSFVDLGILPAGSPIIRALHAVSDYAYRRADGIVTLGECMRRRLLERDIPEEKLHIVDNWADGRSIFPIARHREGDALVLLYSGNLGLAHDVETILNAAEALKKDDRFCFRFAGGGTRRKRVTEFCAERGVRNISWLPYCMRAHLAYSLSECDIGLVTQRSSCVGSVVPSKLYGLMAAGRPILYIGPKHTTAAYVIERFRCGWHIECGDDRGLLALLEVLYARQELIQAAGLRAREAFLAHYDMPQAVAKFCAIIGAPVSTPYKVASGM